MHKLSRSIIIYCVSQLLFAASAVANGSHAKKTSSETGWLWHLRYARPLFEQNVVDAQLSSRCV